MKRNEHGWNFTSTTAVNRGYWDPSETMRTLAEEIVANDPSKLPDGEAAVNANNYFKIASLDRLGVEQVAQFQDSSQYTQSTDEYPFWTWYSRLNESGQELLSDSSNLSGGATESSSYNGYVVENNSRTEMPRSYEQSTSIEGILYNYYAATAESAKFNVWNVEEQDSICPAGWDMPVKGNIETVDQIAQNGSWRHLFMDSYGFESGATEARWKVSDYPFNNIKTGYYMGIGGTTDTKQVEEWTAFSTGFSENGVVKGTRASHFYAGGMFNTTGINSKSNGYAVRCVIIMGE